MSFGVYIHWPFCLAKCPYCDFNSHVRERIDQDVWRESYLRGLEHYAAETGPRTVETIFFGGGTPSLMPPDTMAAIIDKIQQLWPMANDVEITMEANPTSVEAEKFAAFKQAGVNRVSIGVQSMQDQDLAFLGRKHNTKEAIQAIEIAQKNDFRYSIDLIYARPQQTLKDWQQELEYALQFVDGHMSLYQLTIERGTVFFQDHSRGAFKMPDEELAADFYNVTQEIMEAHGLPAYEVSNHARPGQESRHNLIYWRYGDYVGVGPGAHGRITVADQKFATREHQVPESWVDLVQKQGYGAHPYEALSDEDQKLEALMMGLRLKEGVEIPDIVDPDRLAHIIKEGWAEQKDTKLVLTREGILRLNAILPYLLRERPAAKIPA